jgi:sulfite exporter TauE/SafE
MLNPRGYVRQSPEGRLAPMPGTLLALGLLLGLKHALEADHLSTVATLAERSSSARQTAGVAAAWGLGHASTLVLLGTVLVALGATLPPRVTRGLELAVGLILIALGFDVLRRLSRARVHVHVHEHGGDRHLHAHAHRHAHEAEHEHAHPPGLWRRSLLIGGVHGLAGSAAVTLLALPQGSTLRALFSLLAFGAGSVVGMVGLSLVVSLPLRISLRQQGWAAGALQATLAAVDLGLGAFIVLQNRPF